MTKTDTIRARVSPELKHDAEEVLEAVGLSTSQAISLFFKQLVYHRGLPFDVRVPNKDTEMAIKQAQSGAGLTRYDNASRMIEDILK